MAFMNQDSLRLRALGRARGRGELVVIGQETRTQQELVEQGHLWQQIADGQRYRFTLSPSGQRMLDKAESPQSSSAGERRVMSDIVSEITAARGSVYGPFLHNALVAQAIKAALRNLPDPDNEGIRWEGLPLDVREGLDLIALKMSRIVTGDPLYLDNWDDIGGYAKIVADRIRRSHKASEESHD